ncbi:alpha-amylase family glycosyl hydrolase [Haliovirga abyssi]|uniref:Glycosyl hydrolase family 13 catalytic domain-containing protein n=1 Tax=Haliovirga abyssi TaxID=2996794 RepID=A0AAU9DN02_9FUSO|nr:alpha-amylase family glycosyl hydrolase [Haliovirga abyssi]BDU51432.1 hypothetical protein HLVA_20010 [Haliovirga abyssi]
MKKIMAIFTVGLIMLGGCGAPQVKKETKNVVKKVEKKVIADITLSNVPSKLPEYSNINKGNIWKNLLIVYPDKNRGGYIIGRGIQADISRKNKMKKRIKMVKDTEVTKEMLASHNLILIGNTKTNRVLQQMDKYLTIKANGDKVIIGKKEYVGKNYGVTYYYPNLYNLNNSMILVMGNSGTALKEYDFKKYDLIAFEGIKQMIPVYSKEKGYGRFNQDWKLDFLEVDPSALDTGENVKLKVGDIKKYPFPKWAEGKVIYEIFLRSYYDSNGDGIGDIQGLIKKLDYIKSLGADIIWLTPIFDSPSYHGYDIKNYFKINKDYGTVEDFRELAEEMHKRGMKLVLDLVLNHCSNQEPHFRDAHNNPNSKYDKWFYFSNIQNTIYHDWFFRDDDNRRDTINSHMPAWNTNNIDVVNFQVSIAKFWMDPNKDGNMNDGADGYRLDYAKGPSHNYWKLFRQKVKAINSKTLLLGEIWTDLDKLPPYFDNEFDAAFDFSLQGAMTSGVFKDVDDTLKSEEKVLPKNAVMARFLSNHDLDRFPTYIPKNQLKVYAALLMTLNGMPTLYYGDEIGQKGEGSDGDEGRRAPMEWYKNNKGAGMTSWTSVYNKNVDGISVEEENGVKGSLLNEYKKLIKVREKYIDIFGTGKAEFITAYEMKNGKEKKARRVLSYFVENGGKKAFVVLNFGKAGEYSLKFDKNYNEEYKEVLNGGENLVLNGNKLKVNLDAFSAKVYIVE